jgi:hypothetical protein
MKSEQLFQLAQPHLIGGAPLATGGRDRWNRRLLERYVPRVRHLQRFANT